MPRTRRTHRALFAALVLSLLGIPAAVSAHTSQAIAETGGMTLNATLLGAPIAIEVTLDQFGNIAEVAINGAAVPDPTGEHRVSFSADGGTTRVSVKAKNTKLSATVKAAGLGDLVGPGRWTGDIFGTGDLTVDYVVGNNGGVPTLTGVVVGALPAGVTASPPTIETKSEDDDSEGHESRAKATIIFSYNGFTKKLTISVSVDTDDDDGQAKLRVTLSGKDVQRLEGAAIGGPHVWSGLLCDGTAVSVTYSVDAVTGVVTFGSASGAPFTRQDTGNGFKVKFDNSQLWFQVRVTPDGATFKLTAKAHVDKCSPDDDSSDGEDHDSDGDGSRGNGDHDSGGGNRSGSGDDHSGGKHSGGGGDD